MPIVIKEVIVKTTVEQQTPQWSRLPEEQIVKTVKRQVMEELMVNGQISILKRDRKNR